MAGVSRWLPGLRAVLRLGKEIHYCGTQLERLADHFTGVNRLGAPVAPLEEPALLAPAPVDFVTIDRLRQRFFQQNGRAARDEEIVALLDGLEPGPFAAEE